MANNGNNGHKGGIMQAEDGKLYSHLEWPNYLLCLFMLCRVASHYLDCLYLIIMEFSLSFLIACFIVLVCFYMSHFSLILLCLLLLILRERKCSTEYDFVM